MTGPEKNRGNEEVEEMTISSFCCHIAFTHPISFSSLAVICEVTLHLRDETMRLYNEEVWRQAEKGKEGDLSGKFSQWKTSSLPDSAHNTLFPQYSKRKTDVLSSCCPV